jgi:hypothetical protein
VTRRRDLGSLLDRATLAGMAAGLALLLWPWWSRGLEVGFFVMLASTLAQIVVSHFRPTDAA